MIRDALRGDWPAIWPIFEEIVRAGDTYAYPADTDKPTAEALWMNKPDRTFVFEHDGKILGTYYLTTNQEGPGKHVCNCGYMVSSDARGMGIARQMCEHSQGIAVAMGFTAMQFNFVASSNEVAVALWKKLGFNVVGTLPRAFNHPTLGLVDALVMYKWLADKHANSGPEAENTVMNDPYLFSVTNHVATFSVNDAPFNLMPVTYIDRLEEQLPEVLADDTIRAIVFTAEGLANFSAGMNLRQIPEGIKRAGSPEAFFAQRHRVLDMIENGGTPAIATFFGYCLGAGLELPLACHFRIAASEGAKIGLPEMDLGSVPAWGGSARLPRVVGRSHALDMILRARKIDGHEALQMGLVTEVVPLEQLKARAQALGEELAAQPRLAVKAVLDTLVGFETKTLEESIEDEKRAVAATLGTPDSQEGMNAFLEKRKPVFNQS